MGFINLIKNKNPIIELKQEVEASGLPVILYGAAIVGERTYDYLTNIGVNVDAVAIDKEYFFSEQTVFFKGNKLCSIDEIVDKYTSINLFIGFYVNNMSSIIKRKTEMIIKKGLNINNVYMIDYSSLIPERFISYQFVMENVREFEWLYNILADQRSKDVLVAFLNQRISMQIGELDKVRNENQYFPQSIVKFNDNEVYIDCGAYDGDTVQKFIDILKDQNVNRYERIYALEPDGVNYQELCKNCKHLSNIFLINKGAWNKEGALRFSGNKQMSSMITEFGEDIVKVTTIDKILKGGKATFIKMDIQEAEYEALKGAFDTIKNYAPKLAICVYHKKQDLLTIPRYIYNINSNYNFYLRAHSSESKEVVLYCVTC